MMEIIEKLPMWLQDIPTYLGTLVIVATAIVRLPPLNHHEEKVSKVMDVIQKILAWLPTLGKNPGTQALEKKIKK